jgi:UDP-glucuronate 4-epimerase
MSVLVTGAAGFIGHHVCRALLGQGETVIGLDNFEGQFRQLKQDRLAHVQEVTGGRFEFLEADLGDYVPLSQKLGGSSFDRIVHLGAQAGVRYSIENPHAYVRSNLVGHANILEIARDRRSTHLVYASSSSVYGDSANLPFSLEDRADRPVSLYAATKRADELMSESYAHLYKLPQTGLRFFTVYGPWGRPDMAVWLFTHAILTGESIRIFGETSMRRDFTYIDDVVGGILAALENPPEADARQSPHRIYNIGNSKSEELETLIGIIEKSCGRAAIRKLVSAQPGDVINTYADITESRAKLGFNPCVSLEEGIPRFVAWYRSYAGI